MKKDNKKPKLSKEEQDKKLVNLIQDKFRKAYSAKESLHAEWDKCFKAYTGELFEEGKPDYAADQLSNYIFSTVETVKPIMLANNPKVIALPREEEYFDKAEMVQQIIDYEWRRTRMFRTLHTAITTGLIVGTVPLSVIWDSKADNGLGQIKVLPISPFNVFVDPFATNVDDTEYIIYADYKPIGKVLEFAPDKKQELLDSTEQPDDKWLVYNKDVTNVRADQSILYIEAYYRDYSVDLVEERDDEGNKVVKSKMKYPKGRRVIIAGDVLLYDGENPYEDGKFPFVFWKCYETPGKFWGTGIVKHLVSPQRYASALTNNLLDNARINSNPAWILDKNCGVAKNSLTNRSGLVIRKNPGTEVRREGAPAMPAYLGNLIQMFKDDIELVSGVYDVTRGERPKGITAAAAIQALNEQAQGRIRLKIQALEEMLSDLGGLWMSRIKQFWVTNRTIVNLSEDDKPEFFDVDRDEVDGDWDIIISAGSTMAVNKTARLQQLIQLSQTQAEDGLPLVDRQSVLENADIPDAQKIIERFEQRRQEVLQQQQMMQEQAMLEQMPQEGLEGLEGVSPEQLMEEDETEVSSSLKNVPTEDLTSILEQLEGGDDEMALQNLLYQLQLGQQGSEEGLEGTLDEEQPLDTQTLVEMLMALIQTLEPDELMTLLEQYPNLEVLIELIAQIEQPETGLEGDEVNG